MKKLLLSFAIAIVLTGCDIRENAVMREQSDMFTVEMQYRQKRELELINELKVAQEKINKLELMLSCQEDLIEKRVGGIYSQDPLTIEESEINPVKSNKVKEEREIVNE